MWIMIIIAVFFMAVFGTMFWAGFSGAPYLPTSKKKLKAALALAEIKAGEIVGDLGCGDGRFLFLASRETPARMVIGWEISLLPYLASMIKKLFRFRHSRKVIIHYASFYQADFSQLDVIYCFGLPRVMKKLEPKLLRELKPGSRLVSYAFSLPNLQPAKTIKLTKNSPTLFLYKF